MLQIKLEWDPSVSSDAVSQQLHYKLDGVEQPASDALSMETTSFMLNVEEGVEVEWFVRTIDDAGNESDSDPTVFTAADTIPPAPATNLRATTVGEM